MEIKMPVNDDYKSEETATGDIAKSETPLGSEPKKKVEPPECREPDGNHNNCPVFNIDNVDNFKRIIDGRKKHERWQKYIDDQGIRNWIKKNPIKQFYVKYKDVHMYAR